MKLEFEKNLVVSTCHITSADMDYLLSEDHSLSIQDNEYCVLVLVQMGEATSDNFSNDFEKLFNLAKSNGCTFLKLDRDGPEIEGFKVHEW